MSHAEGSCRKKNYPDRNNYRYFNVITCNIYVLGEFLSVTHSVHLAVIVSGVRLPLRGRELTPKSNPVWCHGSILIGNESK